MIAVIDTNVLVSGLWSPAGNASVVISAVLSGRITPCHDYRIINEYKDVLSRPKFKFLPDQVACLLDVFIQDGMSVVPTPLPNIPMIDEDDRPFYEVAKYCHAPLISGNLKHYPDDPLVISLAEFVHKYL